MALGNPGEEGWSQLPHWNPGAIRDVFYEVQLMRHAGFKQHTLKMDSHYLHCFLSWELDLNLHIPLPGHVQEVPGNCCLSAA